GIPPRLCATDRAGPVAHEHTDRRRRRTADLRGRALQADLVPVLIGRLKQESVLRGRPLEGLAITRSAAGKAPGRAIVEFTVTSQGFPEPGNAPSSQKEKP